MRTLAEAQRIILDSLSPLPGRPMPLAEAHRHVLAEDVRADAPYPAGDRSMMDGYVVRADSHPGEFQVVGEIPAGIVPTRALEPGEAMRIFTGALVPAGGGRVVMQEDVERLGERVRIAKFGERLFIRPQGSEAERGAVVLPAGSRLGAAELAILAQVGAVRPVVVPRPRIRHLATGGEIVPPSAQPAPGQIRDTNSTLLAALFADAGVAEVSAAQAPDDLAQLVALASEPADLLVISGGASVGDYDFGAAALRQLGFTIHFDKVNLRPGKPLTFATRDRHAAFVVPGNPVSHFVCFHVAIRLAIERLAGAPPAWSLAWLPLQGGEPLRPDPRETYWPARVAAHAGQLTVTPKRWSTSGDTFSLAGTNALVRVNEHSPADGRVETLLLDAPAST